MNKKQKIVLGLIIVIIALVFILVPRYKIVKLGGYSDDYIKTKSGTSLYKRSKGKIQFDWPIITRILLPVVIIGPILIILLKNRERKNYD
ncbi:MAG: hypothetical protein Q8O13_08140 [Candidatus Omnitrophota bacterium]|nr:hypothetical protein [Candidatus Omnitrophota bacterium]